MFKIKNWFVVLKHSEVNVKIIETYNNNAFGFIYDKIKILDEEGLQYHKWKQNT